jgi:hypothetical protein
MDSAQSLVRGNYKVYLNILKRENDEIYYNKNIPSWLNLKEKEKLEVAKINSMYFGNFRVDHLKYRSYFKNLNLKNLELKDKVCFISDPKENWNSPLDFSKEKPDIVIEKDLNFPSSIVYLPFIADSCFVINTSSAYWDIKKVNKNTAMLQTKNPGNREIKYIDLVYEKEDPNAKFDLLNMQDEDKFIILEKWLGRERDINEAYIENNNASVNLLNYLEEKEVK